MTLLKCKCLNYNLLVVKSVEDILDSAVWKITFSHILYTLPKGLNQQMYAFIDWINEYITENEIFFFCYKHAGSQETVLKLAMAILVFYGFNYWL